MHVSVPFILLLLIVVTIPLLIIAAYRWRSSRGPADPSCGQCGYAVRGLSTFTCPECGADLREVGIRTASLGGTSSFLLLAAAWIIVFLAVGGIGLPMLGSIVPYASKAQQQRVIFIQADYLRTTVRAETEWLTTGGFASRSTPPASTPVTLSFDSSNAATPLVLTQPATASEPAIMNWLQQAGHAVTDPRVADCVHDLALCIDEMKQSATTSFTHLPEVTAHPTFGWTQSGGAPWFRIVYGLLWLALLIAGLIWIRRRTGAGLREAIGVPVVVAVVLGVIILFLQVA